MPHPSGHSYLRLLTQECCADSKTHIIINKVDTDKLNTIANLESSYFDRLSFIGDMSRIERNQ